MNHSKHILLGGLFLTTLFSCVESPQKSEHHETEEHGHEESVEEVMLSKEKAEAMGLEIGPVKEKSFSTFIQANGQLEVPPQNTATITTSIGANVLEILVIEGDEIQKGETVAYISHPDLIVLQTKYLESHNRLALLKSEFERQQKLYKAGVVSGASFQQAKTEYQIAQGLEKGLKAQLRLLNLNPANILSGNIHQRIPLTSPINGAVQTVEVRTGQYVEPQTDLMEIVNTDHVHVDLMVFESDVHLLETGQKVNFQVQSQPGKTLTAEIISIGKTFERTPKAVHVHAEIIDKPKYLIPGMYVTGKIAVGKTNARALPTDAVVQEDGKSIVFQAIKEGDGWSFRPLEITVAQKNEDWTAVEFTKNPGQNAQFVLNKAYYLMAEMDKGEGGGHHH